jgi:hypothetical protein
MQCPACNGKRLTATDLGTRIYRCNRCEAIFGDCYLGDSYTIVKPYMAREDVSSDQLRYFDLDCLGSKGLTRRHGWYDPETQLVHQIG